jgi:hypothetical protein
VQINWDFTAPLPPLQRKCIEVGQSLSNISTAMMVNTLHRQCLQLIGPLVHRYR